MSRVAVASFPARPGRGVPGLPEGGTVVVPAFGAGLAGWLLLLSGAGKLTLWADFRRGLAEARTLPPWLAAGAGWGAPGAEIAVGAAVLASPGWWALGAAAALFALFAAYQIAAGRVGRADCHCYGRLRQMRSGTPAAVGNGALALLSLAVAAGGPGSAVAARLLGGLVLAIAYLAAMGTSANGHTRFVFAEVRYLQERAQGRSDREARATVAKEFGLSPEASYLLLPRGRAAVILVRQRLGLKTTL